MAEPDDRVPTSRPPAAPAPSKRRWTLLRSRRPFASSWTGWSAWNVPCPGRRRLGAGSLHPPPSSPGPAAAGDGVAWRRSATARQSLLPGSVARSYVRAAGRGSNGNSYPSLVEESARRHTELLATKRPTPAAHVARVPVCGALHHAAPRGSTRRAVAPYRTTRSPSVTVPPPRQIDPDPGKPLSHDMALYAPSSSGVATVPLSWA